MRTRWSLNQVRSASRYNTITRYILLSTNARLDENRKTDIIPPEYGGMVSFDHHANVPFKAPLPCSALVAANSTRIIAFGQIVRTRKRLRANCTRTGSFPVRTCPSSNSRRTRTKISINFFSSHGPFVVRFRGSSNARPSGLFRTIVCTRVVFTTDYESLHSILIVTVRIRMRFELFVHFNQSR